MLRSKRIIRITILLVVLVSVINPGGKAVVAETNGWPEKTHGLSPPTDSRDLIVFIAKWKSNLYRLVGSRPVPYGTARFYNPISIVSDPVQQCFYVLDRPKLVSETTKIWRVESDGSARVIFEGHSTTNGGPFSKPLSLGLDGRAGVLIADAVTGLWRLNANGRLVRLFDGKRKPLYRITAAVGGKRGGLIIGTSYMHEVTGGQMLNLPHGRFRLKTWSPSPSISNKALEIFTPVYPVAKGGFGHTGVGNSSGRQVPIRVWKNQGGLFLLDASGSQPKIAGVVVNRRPGGPEHETYWRTLRQVFIDAAGRLVLVDSGSIKRRTENVYIGGGKNSSNKRVTRSVISGGILVLHTNGSLENLMFKTPQGNSGPMRHPHGVAQWSQNTYIVADPEMYVKGVNGSGGLLLLNLDGSRQAKWTFGHRLKPIGVAILRGAGTPAEMTPVRHLRINELAGVHTAGRITRIESVSWQRKGANSGPLAAIGMNWQSQPTDQAIARLRSVFEGARWAIGRNGSLHFSAAGINPQQQDTPLVMDGTIMIQEQVGNISASYRSSSMYETQVGSLDGRLRSNKPRQVLIEITVNMFTKVERLKATFEQLMSL
ncbi:hypothetical protein ACLG6S_17650 [Thermodesulfobacteriota bacterium B35]